MAKIAKYLSYQNYVDLMLHNLFEFVQ